MRKTLLLLFILMLASLASSAQIATGFTKVANVTTTSYTDSSCPNLSTCAYQVTSVDSSNFESAPAACASTQLCVGGNEAVAQMPSSGTHTVAVSWVASPASGVTYNVYRHVGPLPASAIATVVN